MGVPWNCPGSIVEMALVLAGRRWRAVAVGRESGRGSGGCAAAFLGRWQCNACTSALLGQDGGGGRAAASVAGMDDGGGRYAVALLGLGRRCWGVWAVASVGQPARCWTMTMM